MFTESKWITCDYLLFFPSLLSFFSTPWEVMTSKPRLVDEYFSALAGTEKLCSGKAAAQVDGPEGHLAQRSENSSWSAQANTHGKAFTRAE